MSVVFLDESVKVRGGKTVALYVAEVDNHVQLGIDGRFVDLEFSAASSLMNSLSQAINRLYRERTGDG